MKVSVLRYAAIGMATLSLAGFAAASTVSLGTTGPSSHNNVNLDNSNKVTTTNHNGIGVGNLSAQDSSTGKVDANNNTSVSGDLKSGSANNSNSADTTVTVDNSASGMGAGSMSFPDDSVTMDTTGPNSKNEVNISNK